MKIVMKMLLQPVALADRVRFQLTWPDGTVITENTVPIAPGRGLVGFELELHTVPLQPEQVEPDAEVLEPPDDQPGPGYGG